MLANGVLHAPGSRRLKLAALCGLSIAALFAQQAAATTILDDGGSHSIVGPHSGVQLSNATAATLEVGAVVAAPDNPTVTAGTHGIGVSGGSTLYGNDGTTRGGEGRTRGGSGLQLDAASTASVSAGSYVGGVAGTSGGSGAAAFDSSLARHGRVVYWRTGTYEWR